MKRMYSYLLAAVAAVTCFTSSLMAEAVPVTIDDAVIDVPGLTTYTGKLALVIAAVIGASLTFILIRKGVRAIRGIG